MADAQVTHGPEAAHAAAGNSGGQHAEQSLAAADPGHPTSGGLAAEPKALAKSGSGDGHGASEEALLLRKMAETALRLLRHCRMSLPAGAVEARLAAEDPALYESARRLRPSAHTLVEALLCTGEQKAVTQQMKCGFLCLRAI